MRDVVMFLATLALGILGGSHLARMNQPPARNDIVEANHYYDQRAAKDELARLTKQVEQLVAQSDIARAEAIKQKARADALEFFLGTVLPGVKPDALIPPPVIPLPTKPVD